MIAAASSAALFVGLLAGCSSSGGGSGSKLSKADFITQANAACASTLAKIKTAPTPSSLTDYATIHAYMTLGLTEEPKFLDTVTKLVDRSPDKSTLHKNWIDPETASFAQQKPTVEQLDAAAQAKDASKVSTLVNKLSSFDSPDDGSFLTGYGLTQCAALTNYGNS